jgi:hypothetical protein
VVRKWTYKKPATTASRIATPAKIPPMRFPGAWITDAEEEICAATTAAEEDVVPALAENCADDADLSCAEAESCGLAGGSAATAALLPDPVPLQSLQISPQIGGVLVAEITVFLQCLVNDVFELRRNLRIEPNRSGGSVFQNPVKDRSGSISAKGHGAGGHFVKHSAKGKQIGARIELFAHRLFWRHISHGAQRRAGAGEVLFVDAGGLSGGAGVEARRTCARREFGKAEIQYLGVTAFGDEQVRGFDVAMNDAFAMGRVERIRNFDRQRYQRLVLQRSPHDVVLQGHAIQKFHGDECPAVLVAYVINRADIRVIQRGRGLRFALKTGQRLRIAGNFFGQELESDETMQPCVLGFVDHTHAPATKFFDDAIVRDGLANHRKRRLQGRFILRTQPKLVNE